MKKSEQIEINEKCLNAIKEFNTTDTELERVERLRTCTARVAVYPDVYVLQSYNTIVAFIDRKTDTLYDVLRYMYGYTSTSAQHIAKFEKDYCNGLWNCAHRYTYRPV